MFFHPTVNQLVDGKAARVRVGLGDEPAHRAGFLQLLHCSQKLGHLFGGAGPARGFRVEGDQREGAGKIKAQTLAQFFPAHLGHGADVFIPQAAHIEHGVRRFAHADDPPGVLRAAGEMQVGHLGDAMAVVVVRRTQGHVAAADVGNGHPGHGRRLSRREDLVPVAQNQHRVRFMLPEPAAELLDGVGHGVRRGQRAGAELQNGDAGGDGYPVRLDLLHGIAEFRGQMGAGHQYF